MQLLNGPTHVIAKIIKLVIVSAAEAEICASFLAAQGSIPIKACLEELGYKQSPTLIRVDNTTTVGFLNKTMQHKRLKAINTRFYWSQDRCTQDQFNIYWAPGATNLADYHSLNHPPFHHNKSRPIILNDLAQ